MAARNRLFKSDAVKLAEFLIWLTDNDCKAMDEIKKIVRRSLTKKAYRSNKP